MPDPVLEFGPTRIVCPMLFDVITLGVYPIVIGFLIVIVVLAFADPMAMDPVVKFDPRVMAVVAVVALRFVNERLVPTTPDPARLVTISSSLLLLT